MFQSLFCWRRDSDYNAEISATATTSFNPCFVGEGIQTPFRLQSFKLNLGFNPCFVGEGIQTSNLEVKKNAITVFQSLFCWRRDSDARRISILDSKSSRFNPCFVGEGIQTN